MAVAPTPPAMAELRLAARTARADALIDLSRSEPLPVPLPERCAERVQAEFARSRLYSAPGGLGPVREVLARHASARGGLDVGAERVTITAGAMQGISVALRALLRPGDEAIVARPHFHAHPHQVAMLGAEPRFADATASGGVLEPAALEPLVGPRTRALLLCNPANPAGVVLRRDQLAALLAALPPRVAVVADEVYADYVYAGGFASMLSVVAEEDAGRELIAVETASKTAGMPGWRVGAAVASTPELAARVARAAGTLSGAPSTAGQLAYAAWLEDPPRLDRMAPYRPRLRDALELLGAAGLEVREPEGTYYVWARAPRGGGAPTADGAGGAPTAAPPIGSAERALELARASGVLVWPGALFGDRESVRVSLSVPRRDLREGLTRLADSWREVRLRDIPVSRSGR